MQVSLFKGEFELYRRQQLKLTRSLGLLHAGKAGGTSQQADDEDAPPTPPPPKPAAKIEILPGGKPRSAP